ncbi:MAG: hypothetical protein HQL73_03085 [Magnetococcales bacterium]|nr:hypothetical protein [Magnetococcales bacterium]
MKPSCPSNRSFGLACGAVLAAVALAGWLIWHRPMPIVTASAGLVTLLAWLAPMLLMPFNRLWGRFAIRLGWLNNHLLLGIILYGLLTPLGLLLKLFRRNSWLQYRDTHVKSYFTPVQRQTDASTLTDLF